MFEVHSEYSTPTQTSFMMESGIFYRVEVSGNYLCNVSTDIRADAEWQRTGYLQSWIEYYPEPGSPPEYLDLLVNENSYDWLGTIDGINFSPHTYSPTHNYRIDIIGTGEFANFRISDSAYHDNSGYLTVQINQIPEPSMLLFLGVGSLFLRKKR